MADHCFADTLLECLIDQRTLFLPWILTSGLILGSLVIWVDADDLLVGVVIFCLIGLVAAGATMVHRTDDPLHPLVLLLAVGAARFIVPWSLILAGQGDDPTLRAMGIASPAWNLAAAYTVLGLLAMALAFWMRSNTMPTVEPNTPIGSATMPLVVAGVGLVGIATYFLANAPASEVVHGGFRRVEVQEGSGIYFYLSLLLIPSAVLLTDILLRLGSHWLVSVVPVLIAGAAYFTLGGRARAVTPIVAGLLAVWYRRRSHIRRRKLLLMAALSVLALLWLGFLGDRYRGGEGLRALGPALQMQGFVEYLQGAALTDVGQLHGMAGAIELGPASLEGQTFLTALTWPASAILGLPGRSVGVMVVEETMHLQSPGWGFHASIIGEAYANFGPLGVLVGGVFLGFLGAAIYRRFRLGTLPLFIYSLVVVYLVRIFFESVQKWPEALIVIATAVLMEAVSQRGRQPDRAALPRAEPSSSTSRARA